MIVEALEGVPIPHPPARHMFNEQEQNTFINDNLHFIPRIANRMKNRLQTAEVDELTGVGYLALVKAARKFRNDNNCKFTTYMYKVVTCAMIKSFAQPEGKKNYADKIWIPLDDTEIAYTLPDNSPSPYKVAVKNELFFKVHAAFNKLNAKHQEILFLRFEEDLEFTDIAQTWNVDYNNTYKTFIAAKEAFKCAYYGKIPYIRKTNQNSLNNLRSSFALSKDQELEVNCKYNSGKVQFSIKKLAKEYQVSSATIRRIIKRNQANLLMADQRCENRGSSRLH